MTLKERIKKLKSELELSRKKVEEVKSWGTNINDWPTKELARVVLSRIKGRMYRLWDKLLS
jgi:hypothetical protein